MEVRANRTVLCHTRQAARQLWIVHQGGPDTDNNRVMGLPHEVSASPRHRAGNPLALAAMGRNPAVQRTRRLQRNERPPLRSMQEKAGIHGLGLIGTDTEINIDSGFSK